MKRFVIKKRTPDARRAALVTHIYCRVERRTKTVHLGTLNLELDPALVRDPAANLNAHICIKPNAVAEGAPFILDMETRLQIAAWLEVHGSYLPQREAEARQKEHDDAQERARRLAIEMELRAHLEVEIRAAVLAEMEAQRPKPMEAARLALAEAARGIEREALELRQAGHKLSRKRGPVGRQGALTPLDELRLVTDKIRKECFINFEAACKRAGLMSSRASA